MSSNVFPRSLSDHENDMLPNFTFQNCDKSFEKPYVYETTDAVHNNAWQHRVFKVVNIQRSRVQH